MTFRQTWRQVKAPRRRVIAPMPDLQCEALILFCDYSIKTMIKSFRPMK
tara:strand:- start:2078 stop:2224 length:147 start_codon:yes stop_codon:yes gene_type:complete